MNVDSEPWTNQIDNVAINTRKFHSDGYLLIPDVFTGSEISSIRSAALTSRDHKGDILSNPRLRHILLDSRTLTIARAILRETPVYFGDSSVAYGNQSRGWHKDNADRIDPLAPDWQSDYTVIRFALYLQDHCFHSGGLNIRRGSHQMVDFTSGENVYVRSRPGDLLVWNMRATHSGNGKLLRMLHNYSVDPALMGKIPRRLFEPEEIQRVALFFSFGINDSHLSRLICQLMTRAYMIEIWKNSYYPQEALAEAGRATIMIRNMQEETIGVEGLGQYHEYRPIPY